MSRQLAAPSTTIAALVRFGSKRGNEFVELRVPGGEQYLRLRESWGDVDALAVQREMIRRTFVSISTRRNAWARRGSRCSAYSSLMPLTDTASMTRTAIRSRATTPSCSRKSTGGWPTIPTTTPCSRGVDLSKASEEVHNGYFSIDKKDSWTDTAENNQDQPRQRGARLQPYHEGERETSKPRNAAQVHLFSFGTARRMGQPQRLPDLRAP